ncbi:MAG: YceI family protein [Chloroflexota bacterium]|nr:YceI family protein [Chloroflexota bacterium]
MIKKLTIVGMVLVAVVMALTAYSFLKPPAEASAPIEAIPIELEEAAIVGNLTIRNTTREVTWDATVTPVSESQLEGSASTTINRSDWNLAIPSVPFVADVSEQVRLELDFAAMAQ